MGKKGTTHLDKIQVPLFLSLESPRTPCPAPRGLSTHCLRGAASYLNLRGQ